jgi:putative transposase
MAWKEITRVDARTQFVVAYLSGKFEMMELCAEYRISRPTGYKWVGRYQLDGPQGLLDRSRAPHHCPHRMSEATERWFVRQRRARPKWGPRKLVKRFRTAFAGEPCPSRSAVYRVLKQHGLIKPRIRRARGCGTGTSAKASAPNDLWTIDFKGQFRTGDRCWCYPLTTMDAASRYLLACRGQLDPSGEPVSATMLSLFRQYGLPARIHSDNGSPFASPGLGRLSRVSIQWIKLGIHLERSRAGCPQDNAAHERMHRTLKDATARPPARCLVAQQRRFNSFRREYNQQRPHESLNDHTPAQMYAPSLRPFPARIEPRSYPGHFELRRVSHNGEIKWCGLRLYIGLAFVRETLGLEEIADGLWSMYFSHQLLARWDARSNELIPLLM